MDQEDDVVLEIGEPNVETDMLGIQDIENLNYCYCLQRQTFCQSMLKFQALKDPTSMPVMSYNEIP